MISTLMEAPFFRDLLVVKLNGSNEVKRRLERIGVREGAILVKEASNLAFTTLRMGGLRVTVETNLTTYVIVSWSERRRETLPVYTMPFSKVRTLRTFSERWSS